MNLWVHGSFQAGLFLMFIFYSGILMAFWIGFVAIFLAASERAGNMAGGATQLVFKQNAKIPSLDNPTGTTADPEKGDAPPDQIVQRRQKEAKDAQRGLPEQRSVFSWHHLNYDITAAGGKKRRLLDDVSGFVAPGKMVRFSRCCVCRI
jgi:ATP-binding cassette subfamily G (WHITE) protein 2 (SNQ2)